MTQGWKLDILEWSPGIYSARWGGKKGDFVKAMNRVFKELDKKDKNWKTKKIKARFICALTIYGPNQKTISSLGKIEGYISPSMKGKNGFGYDPIFIPRGKKITFGEMKPCKNIKWITDLKLLKKLKNFFKFIIFNFIKIKNMINFLSLISKIPTFPLNKVFL